jgi:Spy/CpxP family protein refolding chaperone
MKKIILMAIAVVLSAAVIAQNAPAQKPAKKTEGTVKKSSTPEERAQKKADKMKAELKLSDDQASKIKEIYLTEIKEFDASDAKTYANKGDKAKANKEIRKKAQDAYLKVLTPEQAAMEKKIWEENRAKKHDKKGDKK